MTTLRLPLQLQARLDALPRGLRSHIERVRTVARELAAAHGIDVDRAELAAAAHDVARATPPHELLQEAGRLKLPVGPTEARAPILLHGPVGAVWLQREGAITDPEALEGVRWHSTAHPRLSPLGQVVFLADKLDPVKAAMYPFYDAVRQAAFRDLRAGVVVFLDGATELHRQRGEPVHPISLETRTAFSDAGAPSHAPNDP